MTNLIRSVAIGVQGETCKKVADCKQCKRWLVNVELVNPKPHAHPHLY
jgi:hypothetical protein